MKGTATKPLGDEKPSASGWLLFFLGLSLFLSAFPGARPNVAGLSVHPYLVLLVLLFLVFIFSKKDAHVSHGLHGWEYFFVLAIGLSYLANGDLTGSLKSMVKWATMLFTFGIVARGTRRPADLNLGLIGLIFGIALTGGRAIALHQSNPRFYLAAMVGIGNRNNFALWTLGPLACALWIFTADYVSKRIKILLVLAMFCMTIPVIMSLSRAASGLLLITGLLVLGFRKSMHIAILLFLISLSAFYAIDYFDFGARLTERMNTLRDGGTGSDYLRRDMILHGLDLFLENPFFGVSVHKLGDLLGQAMRSSGQLSSHNLFIDLLAGTGLVGTLSISMCFGILVKKWGAAMKTKPSSWRDFASIQPVLLLLLLIRGITSNEIVFCPSLMIALALAYSAANHAIAEGKEIRHIQPDLPENRNGLPNFRRPQGAKP